MLAALASSTGEFYHFVSLAFSGGTVYITDAATNIVWNGHTWLALGGAFSFGSIPESGDLSSAQWELTIGGVGDGGINLFFTQEYLGRAVVVYLVELDASKVVVADPVVLFSGWMNGGFRITEERDEKGVALGTVTIVGTFADRLSMLDQLRGIKTNIGSHQQFFPGDNLYEPVGQESTGAQTFTTTWADSTTP